MRGRGNSGCVAGRVSSVFDPCLPATVFRIKSRNKDPSLTKLCSFRFILQTLLFFDAALWIDGIDRPGDLHLELYAAESLRPAGRLTVPALTGT
jgi:hypothetical protein